MLGPAHEFSQLRLILPLHVGTHSWPASLLEADVHQGSFFLSFLKLCFSVKQSLDCIKMLQMETCVPGNEANDASVLFSYSGGPENIPSSILQIINHQTSKKFSLISYAWF